MSAVKTPGNRIRISNLNARDSSGDARLLLIGTNTTAGLAAANVAFRVLSDSQGDEQAGKGSQLAGMIQAARGFNPNLEIWALPVAENGAGVVATGTIVFSGAATTARPLVLRVEDQRVEVAVAIGDDNEAVAAAVETELALAKYEHLHVTAGAAVATVTFTARSKGLHGNDVALKVLEYPPGITGVLTAMASGASASVLTTAITGLGSTRYTHIVPPSRDATTLAALKTLLDARWDEDLAIDGHVFASGGLAAVATMLTLGESLDDKHLTIISEPLCPTPSWKQAAIVAAARASETNPNATIRNVPLPGIMPADEASRMAATDGETLLVAGIATYRMIGPYIAVNRLCTTIKTNDIGQDTEAFYDLETKLTISAIRQLQITMLDPLIGKILVEDSGATDYNFDVEVVDVEDVRLMLIGQYNTDFMPRGWVTNPDLFAEALVVEKTDVNTISYTWPGYVAGHYYKGDGVIEFKLA